MVMKQVLKEALRETCRELLEEELNDIEHTQESIEELFRQANLVMEKVYDSDDNA